MVFRRVSSGPPAQFSEIPEKRRSTGSATIGGYEVKTVQATDGPRLDAVLATLELATARSIVNTEAVSFV